MTTTWLLLITMHIKDIPTQKYQESFVRSSYCVMRAKQFWHDFYAMEYADGTILETICINQDNHYKFVKVTCDKNDVCNV